MTRLPQITSFPTVVTIGFGFLILGYFVDIGFGDVSYNQNKMRLKTQEAFKNCNSTDYTIDYII